MNNDGMWVSEENFFLLKTKAKGQTLLQAAAHNDVGKSSTGRRQKSMPLPK